MTSRTSIDVYHQGYCDLKDTYSAWGYYRISKLISKRCDSKDDVISKGLIPKGTKSINFGDIEIGQKRVRGQALA